MAGSLDAFLKANPISIKTELDVSGISKSIKELNGVHNVKVGVEIDTKRGLSQSLKELQSTVNGMKKIKVNVEFNLNSRNINSQINALQNQLKSAKKIKLDVDLDINNSINGISSKLGNITKVVKGFESELSGAVKNISQKTNNEFNNLINDSTTQRVTSQLNSIKNDMRNAFGDGLVDTKVFRDAEQQIQRVSATITKSTGEIITRMYSLNEQKGNFELISQTDVDKIESQTNKIKNSLTNLKSNVEGIFQSLGNKSQSFQMFEKLQNADIVSTTELAQLKELINLENQAIVHSQKLAQAKQLIASSLSKVNPQISNVSEGFKKLEQSLDGLDSGGLDKVIAKTKQLASQYKADEQMFKQRESILKNVQNMYDKLAIAEQKMATVGSRGQQNVALMQQARDLLQIAENSTKSAKSVGELKQAFNSLQSASGVFANIKQNMSMDNVEKDVSQAVFAVEKLMHKLVEIGKWDGNNLDRAFTDLANAIEGGLPAINQLGERFSGQLREAQEEARGLVQGVEMISRATKDMAQIDLKRGLLGALDNLDTNSVKQYVSQLEQAKVRTVAVTQGLNAQGQAVYKINAVMDGAGKTVKSYTYEVGKAADALDTFVNKTSSKIVNNENKNLGFFEQMGIAMKRIPGYIISMQGFYRAMQGMRAVTNEIMQVDKAMVELRRVASQDINVDTLFDKAVVSAKELGANIHDVLGALSEFTRTFGDFNENQLMALTKTATVMSNVSDLSLAESSSTLVGTMNAFNIAAEDSVRIVDSLNEVDNQYAISTTQLATGLSKTGAVAKTFGVEMEEVVGHITAIGSVTMESGDVIGNSLKTIYSRMTTHTEAKSALQEVGIALEEMTESGMQVRPVGDVMADLASKWHTLSDSQRQNLAVQVAGRNHLTRFVALMNNWTTATDATATALNSQGSALREQQAYMQSYEARVNGLKTRFTELSISIGRSFLDNGMISAMNGIARFMEMITALINKVGALPSIMSVATAAFAAFLKSKDGFKDMKFLDIMVEGFKKLGSTIMSKGTPAIKALSDDIKKLKSSSKGGFDDLGKPVENLANASKKASADVTAVGTASATAGRVTSTAFMAAGKAVATFVAGLATIALQVAAVMAVGWAIGKVVEKVTEHATKVSELKQRYQEQQEVALEAYNKAGNSFDSYIRRYDELSQKMKTQKLGATELEEYNKLQQELAAIMPNSVKYIDQHGQAHLKSSEAVKQEAKAVRELALERAKLAREEIQQNNRESGKTAEGLWKDYQKYEKQVNSGKRVKIDYFRGYGEYDLTAKEMSKAQMKLQDATQGLSALLSENSIKIGDNVLAWRQAEGKMKNVPSTVQGLVASYAKANQYTEASLKQLQDAMGVGNDKFDLVFEESQKKLLSKTEHFSNAMEKSFNKFEHLSGDFKTQAEDMFTSIVGSLDLSKFGDDTSGLESYFTKIADKILNVKDLSRESFEELKKGLTDLGLDDIEADRAISQLIANLENSDAAMQAAEEAGIAISDTMEQVAEATYTAIDAVSTFFGTIPEQASAVISHLDFINAMKQFSPDTYMSDDRVQNSFDEIAQATGLLRTTVENNFDEINGAFGKFAGLSAEQMASIGQAWLEQGEEWNNITAGMSDSTKELFGRMLQYVVRGGVDMNTAMRIALEGIGTVSEEVQNKMKELFSSEHFEADAANSHFNQWVTTVKKGLQEITGEYNVVEDAHGNLKLQLLDGSSSPFLDELNGQVEALGLTYKTEVGEDGTLKVSVVDENGNSVATLENIEQNMLEAGVAAALLEDAYRDLQEAGRSAESINTFFETSGQILASTGAQLEVFQGGLRATGETTATQQKALAEFNYSLEQLGLQVKSLSQENGQLKFEIIDPATNEVLTYTIDQFGQLNKVVDETNGKEATVTVNGDIQDLEAQAQRVNEEVQNIDGKNPTVKVGADTTELDNASQKTEQTKAEVESTEANMQVGAEANIEDANQATQEIANEVEGTTIEKEVNTKVNDESLALTKQAIADIIASSQSLQDVISLVTSIVDTLLGKTESLQSLQTTLDSIKASAESTTSTIDTLLSKLSESINFGGGFDGSVFDDIRAKVEGLISSLNVLHDKMSQTPSVNTSNAEQAPQQELKAPTIDYSALLSSQSAVIAQMNQAWTTYMSTLTAQFTALAVTLNAIQVGSMAVLTATTLVGTTAITLAFTTMGIAVGAAMTALGVTLNSIFGSTIQGLAGKASTIGHRIASGIHSSAGAAAGAMRALAQGMIDAFSARINSYNFAGVASRISRLVAMSDSPVTDGGSETDVNSDVVQGLFNTVNSEYASVIGAFSEASGETAQSGSGEAMAGISRNLSNNVMRYTSTADDKEVKLEDLYERDTLGLTISRTESFINKANNALKDLVENTQDYRDGLIVITRLNETLVKQENEKLSQTISRQRAIERELQLLKDTTAHTEEQRKEYNKLQQEYDNNTKEIWKLEESIQSLNSSIKKAGVDIYLDFLEELESRWTDVLENVQKSFDGLEHKLSVMELSDDTKVVDTMLVQARMREKSLILEKTYANQVARYQAEYAKNVAQHGKNSKQAKEAKDLLVKAEQDHNKEQLNGLKLEKEIRDSREDIAEENIKNLQSYYKKMQDLSSTAIQKEQKELKKLHEEKKKMYDEELKRIDDIYNKKLETLQSERDGEQYAKKVAEYNKERADLMREISLASRDDSLDGQKRLRELQEELAQVNESLAETQRDRQDELYKQALEKQKENDEARIKSMQEMDDLDYDRQIEALDDKEKQIEKYYNSLLNDDKKWAEITKRFRAGDDGAFGSMTSDMTNEMAKLLSGDGSVIMGAENLSDEDLREILGDELTELASIWYNIEGGISDLSDLQENSLNLQMKNQKGLYATDPIMRSPEPVIQKKIATTTRTAQPNITPEKSPAKSNEQTGIKATHTVVKGDTLWDLAKRYYGDYYKWKKIQAANGNVNPYKLRIGSKLLIPFRSGGYTGDWAGDGGKLAVLHKKELVLNKEQTADLLATVKLLDASRNKASNLINRVNNSSIDNNGVHIEHLELTFEEYKGNKNEAENVAKNILDEIRKRK